MSPHDFPAGLFLTALLFVAALSHQQVSAPPVAPIEVHASARRRRPAPEPSSAAQRALRDGQPLNVNQVNAAALQLLPGVGPTLAQRIVLDRAQRGPFARIEDLTRVRGLGQRTVERLRAWLVVADKVTGEPARP